MTFVIISNAVFVGVEIDWNANNLQAAAQPDGFYVLGHIYAVLFLIELLLQLFAQRINFFHGQGCHWNYLDLFIVFSSTAEMALDIVRLVSDIQANVTETSNIRVARII